MSLVDHVLATIFIRLEMTIDLVEDVMHYLNGVPKEIGCGKNRESATSASAMFHADRGK